MKTGITEPLMLTMNSDFTLQLVKQKGLSFHFRQKGFRENRILTKKKGEGKHGIRV
jgi:hypothetical protein